MNERGNEFSGLDKLMTNSMVEMPVALEERLMEIPSRITVIDWAFVLPLVFLTPLAVMGVVVFGPELLDLFMKGIEKFVTLLTHPPNLNHYRVPLAAASIICTWFLAYLSTRDRVTG